MPSTVLITGATSGIGHAFARLFARDGYVVVLHGRSAEKLEAVRAELAAAGTACHLVVQDLSEADAAEKLVAELDKQGLAIDTLVNNAGMGTYGPYWETDPKAERALLAINVVAVATLTKLLLPGMIERGHGDILTIGSVAGFTASPYATTYYASKAFIQHFCDGLRTSLKGTGVNVTLSCPGPTSDTNFNRHIVPAEGKERKWLDWPHLSADQVAAISYRAMRRRKRLVIPGHLNASLVFLLQLIPRSLVIWATGHGQKYVNE